MRKGGAGNTETKEKNPLASVYEGVAELIRQDEETHLANESAPEDQEIDISLLVLSMIRENDGDLDAFLVAIERAGRQERGIYRSDPFNLHNLITLMDNSNKPIDALIEFMKKFEQLIGKDFFCAVNNKKRNILHMLAEKPRLAGLYSTIMSYFSEEDQSDLHIAEDKEQQTSFDLILYHRNVKLFDEVFDETIINLGEAGKKIMRGLIKGNVLQLICHTTTEFEKDLEKAYSENCFEKRPKSRRPSEPAEHINLIMQMIDRIEKIFTEVELAQQALALDEKGQTLLIKCCYLGDEALIERCSRWYMSESVRNKVASQILSSTSSTAIHITSGYGRVGTLRLLLSMLYAEDRRKHCSHPMLPKLIIAVEESPRNRRQERTFENWTPLHCAYLSGQLTQSDSSELADIMTVFCEVLGGDLVSVVMQNTGVMSKFIIQESIHRDQVIINKIVESEQIPHRSDLLLAICCRLPFHYFQLEQKSKIDSRSSSPRSGSVSSQDSVLTPRSLLTSMSVVQVDGPQLTQRGLLWERFVSLSHLQQAGFQAEKSSNEFFMRIDSKPVVMKHIVSKEEDITQILTLHDIRSNQTMQVSKNQKLLAKLFSRLLGPSFPVKLLQEIVKFLQSTYPKNKLMNNAINDWIMPTLVENITVQTRDDVYYMLIALFCYPDKKYHDTCQEKVGLFAVKLAQLFVCLDNYQQGLSSKIIVSMMDKQYLMGSTIFELFEFEDKDYLDESTFEVALRLKVIFYANEGVIEDLITSFDQYSDDQIYHTRDGINLLNLFLQHANNFMMGSEFGDIGQYRGQIKILTEMLLKKLGVAKVKRLVSQRTEKETNLFHVLARFKKIGFLLEKFYDVLDVQSLSAELTREDQDGATPFHYACYFGNTDFIKILIEGIDQKRVDSKLLRDVGRKVTKSGGYNVFHLACMSHDDERINAVTQWFIEGESSLPQNVSRGFLSEISHKDACVIVNDLDILYHSTAAMVGLTYSKNGINAFGYACLTGNTDLMSACSAAYKTAKSKQRAVNQLIAPKEQPLDIYPLDVVVAIGDKRGVELILSMCSEDNQTICMHQSKGHGLGRNTLDWCYAFTASTSAERQTETEVVSTIVNCVGKRLPTVLSRTATVLSPLHHSLLRDRVIVSALLTSDSAVDCIEVIYEVLKDNSEEEVTQFASYDRWIKTPLQSDNLTQSLALRSDKERSTQVHSVKQERGQSILIQNILARRISPRKPVNTENVGSPLAIRNRGNTVVGSVHPANLTSVQSSNSTPTSGRKRRGTLGDQVAIVEQRNKANFLAAKRTLADLKMKLLNHSLGFTCPLEIHQILTQIIQESLLSKSQETHKAGLLLVMLNKLTHIQQPNELYAVLILAAHIMVSETLNVIEAKFVEKCAENKEFFASSLIGLYKLLCSKQSNLDILLVGKIFANSTLLRSMICSTFDILDDEIINILGQYERLQIRDVTQPKNVLGQNLLQALLLKCANRKEDTNGISAIVSSLCEMAGDDAMTQLASNDDGEGRSLMHVLAENPGLFCVLSFAEKWVIKDELTRQLTALDFSKRSVLTIALTSRNVAMLCFIDKHLDENAMLVSFPRAQNIVHALLLHFAGDKDIERGDSSVEAFITELFTAIGGEKLKKYTSQLTSDDRTVLHILAEFPKLFFILPLLEKQVGKEALFALSKLSVGNAESVISTICKQGNLRMLSWYIQSLPAQADDIDLGTRSVDYLSLHEYIFEELDIDAFEYLCRTIGKPNVKYLIDGMKENVLHIICRVRSGDVIYSQQFYEAGLTDSSKLQRNLDHDDTVCKKQVRLLDAVCELFTDKVELEKLALHCCGQNRNLFQLACYTGNPVLIQKCAKLYLTERSLLVAVKNELSLTGASALHFVCTFCSADVVRIVLKALGKDAADMIMKVLERFGNQNALHCCYFIEPTSAHEIEERKKILELLCAALGERLITAVIRSNDENVTSLIELSAGSDNIIIKALSKMELSSRCTELLLDVSRGSVKLQKLPAKANPVPSSPRQDDSHINKTSPRTMVKGVSRGAKGEIGRGRGVASSHDDSHINKTSPRALIGMGRGAVGEIGKGQGIASQETNRRRGNTYSAGQLPAPDFRRGSATPKIKLTDEMSTQRSDLKEKTTKIALARPVSPRKASSLGRAASASIIHNFDTLKLLKVNSNAAEAEEQKVKLLQQLLGINYPSGLILKIISVIEDFYKSETISEKTPTRVLISLLVKQVFDDIKSDRVVQFAHIILALHCEVDDSAIDYCELYIRNCNEHSLEFEELLICLLQKFSEGATPLREKFIAKLLAGKSLLRKAIWASLNIPDTQLLTPEKFLTAIQQKAAQSLESKLGGYIKVLDGLDVSKLTTLDKVNSNKNILQVTIEEFTNFTMTAHSEQKVTVFTREFLTKLRDKGVIDTLLSQVTDDDQNILHYLAEIKSMGFLCVLFRELLDKAAFFQLITQKSKKDQVTPLHIACENGNISFFTGENKDGETSMQFLLRVLAESKLSPMEVQSLFTQFCTSAGKSHCRELMSQLNTITEETVLHYLAKYKTLDCLYGVFEKQFSHNKLCNLLTPAGNAAETPLHVAAGNQNLLFIQFCKKIVVAGEVVRGYASMLTKGPAYSVFHVLLISCFSKKIQKLKSILEKREQFPSELFPRDMLTNLRIPVEILQIMQELIDLLGDKTSQIMGQPDNSGNSVLMLACYLNNPDLFSLILKQVQPPSANFCITRTFVTPVQLLCMFGSAELLSKCLEKLGKQAAVQACLQVNKYLGGRNAVGCCYVGYTDKNNIQQRLALNKVFNVLMRVLPIAAMEEALLCQTQAEIVPVVTMCIENEQDLVRDVFLVQGTVYQAGLESSKRVIEHMMDILYEPNVRLISMSLSPEPLQRAPSHLSIFSEVVPAAQSVQVVENVRPLMQVSELRKSLIKRLLINSFIPDELMATMVALVTDTRSRLQTPDRLKIFFNMLMENLKVMHMTDPLNNYTCLFLAMSYPVSEKLNTDEAAYCEFIAKNSDRVILALRDFSLYLNHELKGLGGIFLKHLYKGNTLLKRAIVNAYKSEFSQDILKDESLFLDRLIYIIGNVQGRLEKKM